ncbi:glycoside hydrolase family 3 N-terminal domain-containing protein [Taklimakanibacter lacteus]|uniref:glycoside hydrolase family 3 N-terminal domain-containing protein n=1 Tax=Taklimakanibacter lacteus TaxID=2268456 RepID=UPI000E6756DC
MSARLTDRVVQLMRAMSVEEKIGQLNMLTAGLVTTGPGDPANYLEALKAGRLGSLFNLFGRKQVRDVQRIAVEETRLGIPLIFGYDIIHGHRTIFPIPLGEAAAFDAALWERTARIAALEGAAEGLNLTFAPMLDVSRDPRWGRIAESAGEDSWLTSLFAKAKVKGFQGDDVKSPLSLAATAKHLAAYGAAMAGRDYAEVEISERALHEVYLPPFEASVKAGVAALMPAFTDMDSIPLTAHVAILRDIVRRQWGFEGVIISDYNAIAELIAHGIAADLTEAATLALKAGVDIDMMGHAYVQGLPKALQSGAVTMDLIDQAVGRVLMLKEQLGLFDDPYRDAAANFDHKARRVEYRDAALDAARRSIVLLTNRNNVLPIRQAPRRVAILGPLANAQAEMLGPWSGAGLIEDMVPFLPGLRAAWPQSEILHTAGVDIEGGDLDGIAAAVDMARRADLTILCLGEQRFMSGEAGSRGRPDLPGHQAELAKAVLDVGKPVIVLLSSGRPLAVTDLIERADAVLATWFLGSEAGHAVADVVTGLWNPSAKLPVSWPVDVGQIPVFYAHRPSGRPKLSDFRYESKYLDLPNEPLFPFGHGLSYTRFTYSGFSASPSELRPGNKVTLDVTVSNEGEVAGEETALFFMRDPVASVSRPVLELKGLAKLTLAPGQSQTVTVVLTTADMMFPGQDFASKLEAGEFLFFVGSSAREETLLKASVRLVR